MRLVRSIARPLMAGLFIVSGMDVLANPEPRAKLAKPVVDRVAAMIPIAPSDPVAAVTLNAAVHVGAGTMLAAGILPRLAALALATSVVPTTLAAHRYWEVEDAVQRSRQRVEFLKNTAILGGLLVVALD
jgi:putative oxidoreductase